MRLRAQCLSLRAEPGDAVAVTRAVCGVNAQLRPAMLLSLRARIRGAELQDLSDLINGSSELVRTWAMRGTLHLLARDDAGLVLPLVGPGIIAKYKNRRRDLGLGEERLARGLAEVTEIFETEGPLTRDALVERLNDRGFSLDRKSQAIYHLIVCAGLKGMITLGPDGPGGEQRYVLADQPSNPEPKEEALAELAERYLDGYGPAGAADFASWSALSAADAKRGWERMHARGQRPEVTGHEFTETVVNLLPAFDSLLLGYADRSLIVPDKYYEQVYHGGQVVPVVLVNGEAAGIWRYEIRGRRITVQIRQFEAMDGRERRMVGEEADDVGRFFGLEPAIEWR